MTDEPKLMSSVGSQVARTFDKSIDAPSFYSDLAQIVSTGTEVVIQFYETIPNPPGASGKIESARSRLRASVILSPTHARKIGENLLQQLAKQ